jgi:hypothetical protein
MQYIPTGSDKKYSFSYKELKHLYERYIGLTDDEFIKELYDILHFACFVSYVKELNREQTTSDEGIIHQLVHLLKAHETDADLKEIRTDFETLLKLS